MTEQYTKQQIRNQINEVNFERCKWFSIIISFIGLGLAISDIFIYDLSINIYKYLHWSHWYLFIISIGVLSYTLLSKNKKKGTLLAIIYAFLVLSTAVLYGSVIDIILQRGITAFLFTILAIGTILFFRIPLAILINGLTYMAFLIFLFIFQEDYNLLTGQIVNGTSFTLITVFLMISNHDRKAKEIKQGLIIKAQSAKLEEKSQFLENTNLQLTQKNKEVENQKNEIILQRDRILYQNREIRDSIIYAQNIQKAIIPSKKEMKSDFKDYFIIFKPKEIVSGDFYYYKKIGDWKIIAVADCTGHGVPGAFMSMLGISYMNELVRREEVKTTGDMLSMLRDLIVETLHQEGKAGEQKDGMDISVCAINESENLLQFSSANNPAIAICNDGAHDFIPDKMPISIHCTMKKFNTQEFKLSDINKLYMFSDGYADQFGGPKGKKIKLPIFKDQLISTSNLSMTLQKEKLEKKLEEWMMYGNTMQEQIDDITILGIEF